MRVAMLGCGYYGRGIAYQLGASDAVSQLVIADKDEEAASRIATKIGAKACSRTVDVFEPQSLEAILKGVDVVFNAVGPFYKTALGVIRAAIKCKVNYMDICDDYDVWEELFTKPDYDAMAKEAGITVLVSLGGSPGLTNILSKYGSQQLERVKAVHCSAAFDGFGPRAAMHHMLHVLTREVPQYLGGRYVRVEPFSGMEWVRFLDPVGWLEAFYYGHAEPVTLPRFIPGLEEATVKVAYFLPETGRLFSEIVKCGFADEKRIEGLAESPIEYMAAYLASPEGAQYFNIKDARKYPYWIVRTEIIGESEGCRVRLVYQVRDETRRAVTASAAIAAESLIRGEISVKGITAPEGAIDPVPFLNKLSQEPGITIYESKEVLGTLCRPFS